MASGRLGVVAIDTPLGTMVAAFDGAGALVRLEFADASADGAPGAEALDPVAVAGRWAGPGETAVPAEEALARSLIEPLEAYFEGAVQAFDLPPLAPRGTAFELAVWDRLRQIPYGMTNTYGALARGLGQPGGVRAVGRANGANPIAILIPCHRVIGSDGSLVGYGGGLWRKRALLAIEGTMLPGF